MAKIATYASKKTIVEKPGYGLQVITMGTNNPSVPGNGPVLAEFATVNTQLLNLNAEIDVVREQLRSKVSERETLLPIWNAKLNAVAGYTLGATGGNPAAIESAGFYVVPPRTPSQPLEAPINVRVTTNGSPGVSKITWKPVEDAWSYLLQSSEDGIEWSESIACTKARHETTGAEPGKVCWFRVAGLNPLGQGPWSEPARRPVM